MRLCRIAGVVTVMLVAALVDAEDTVKTAGRGNVQGRVTLSALEVSVETPAASVEKVPVNEIEWISFEGEPSELKAVRNDIAKGNYEQALRTLEKIKVERISRDEIKQEVEYYRAYCTARLALAGSGEAVPAGKLMIAFTRNYPNSHHTLEANEIVGDLLVAMGQSAKARPYYEKVAAAPWPDYKMRASVAVGNALMAEGKYPEALGHFDAVLKQKVEGDLAEVQRKAAILGKARCLAETGDPKTALKAIDAMIAKAEPDEVDYLAQAYNVKGVALLRDGKPREAMFAFLRVDTLYSANREAHAEALYHLARVCRELRKPDRARDFETMLQEQYAESRWNRAESK
ncbi:MAG: tetratricopeptide repeat protein [Thermoguttaceae bacterium]|nr:tetratricopeptide repeat protein [Thermoguttaceae bacterium]